MQAAKPLTDAASASSASVKTLPKVALETALGPIVVEIDTLAAPVTAANFLRYVDAGAYEGGQFHRTVTPDNQPDNEIRIGVIQGSARKGAAEYGPIPLERTSKTGIPHLNGTISMARTGADSATNQFFLCVGDQPELDFGGRRNADGQGFAAFGRLVAGWLVLRQIQMSPAAGQELQPPVSIVRARRL
ncbi:MAG: peptidylprolyl isomerase [Acidobacteria bacterium]|nr:peptidylprolyl isomerase [Acidobacteriota bacterium]